MLQKKRLGDILLKQGLINENDLESALAKQKEHKEKGKHKKLGEILKETANLKEKNILKALSKQFSFPIYSLSDIEKKMNPKTLKKLDLNFVKEEKIIPIDENKNEVFIILNNPLNINAIEEIEIKFKKKAKEILATKEDIEYIISIIDKEEITKEGDTEKLVEEIKTEVQNLSKNQEVNKENIEDLAQDTAVVKLTDEIINEGIRKKASDIHIEPLEEKAEIRYRINGILYKDREFSKTILPYVTSRIKTMAGLDIAERRLPQDGRIKKEKIDLRVSTINTIRGEKIVLRILDKNQNMELEKLGFTDENENKILNMIDKPKGLILVTGATGSGKTTTLYSMLQKLDYSRKNISTVEDPVEYQVEGINQIQTKEKIGLDFSEVLRSLLRQDPDVVMVGEIRDKETAEIALQASETGHLVLSTVHTNTAIKTLDRLFEMGLEKFLVASALEGIISQNLVRKLCPKCKTKRKASKKELVLFKSKNKNLNIEDEIEIYEANGCDDCIEGYNGRLAIHEILKIDEEFEDMISNNLKTNQLRKKLLEKGHKTLDMDGLKKVKQGLTTIEEVKKASTNF